MQPIQHLDVKSLDDFVALDREKYMVIAGGTDCLGVLKNMILPVYPEVLLNIKTISGLDYIVQDTAGIRIGALARLSDIAASPLVRQNYAIVAEAAESVGSPQIRNMGTLGGNLCQDTRCWYYRCSPLTGRSYNCLRKGGSLCFAVKGDNRYHAILGGKGCFAVCPSDTAVALSALDAQVVLKGPAGERVLPIKDFFTTLGNVLQPHEILTEVRIPRPMRNARQKFIKFRLRKAIDFAIVSVAAVVTVEDGICKKARIALGAVAPTPIRAAAAEASITGMVVNTQTAEDAGKAAVTGAKPLSMSAYKCEITKALVKRALLS